MREIKFRGKTATGDWVYGSLVYSKNIQPAIYFEVGKGSVKTFDFVYVIPETVGQYTGQMDKYGRKIFDGDLVKTCPSTITAKEGFPSKVFEVRLGFEMKWFGYKGTNSFYKIVGNIHDKEESK